MKKLLILISIFLSSITFTYADDEGTSTTSKEGVVVTVTEKIPWANCEGQDTNGDDVIDSYDCVIERKFGSVVGMIGSIIRYFTFIAGLAGVLYIVINGIMYSMWGIDQGMKDEAKKRIISTLVGLVLLFLSWVILYMIAPWIYTA